MQWQKNHNQQNDTNPIFHLATIHNLKNLSPLGLSFPPNPLGKKRTLTPLPLWGLNEVFLELDARKTIDDNLLYITRDLLKFRSLHGLTSGVIMGIAKKIQVPLERVQQPTATVI
jgi:hypothetical protein